MQSGTITFFALLFNSLRNSAYWPHLIHLSMPHVVRLLFRESECERERERERERNGGRQGEGRERQRERGNNQGPNLEPSTEGLLMRRLHHHSSAADWLINTGAHSTVNGVLLPPSPCGRWTPLNPFGSSPPLPSPLTDRSSLHLEHGGAWQCAEQRTLQSYLLTIIDSEERWKELWWREREKEKRAVGDRGREGEKEAAWHTSMQRQWRERAMEWEGKGWQRETKRGDRERQR